MIKYLKSSKKKIQKIIDKDELFDELSRFRDFDEEEKAIF